MKTSQLDNVDRQLLHALQVSPRASFRLLGEVIGVSDQTIGRRYRRLTQVVDLRVHGAVHGQRAGWVDWLVRIQVAPGSAERIATALAARPDTRWVRLFSGGAEINCTLQARTPDQPTALFLRGLPGSRHVTNITAHSILNVFSPVEFGAYTGVLTDSQVAALRAESAPEEAGPGSAPALGSAPNAPAQGGPALRPEDEPLLTALSRDGRAPVSELAAATHWHESTVRRRVAELQRAGVLYFDIDVDDYLVLGARSHVMMWLTAEPAHLDAAGQALAALPEVPFAAATTGPTNLVASGVFRDPAELYAFLTTSLTGIPGLRSVETAPVIGTVKRAGEREIAPGARREGDLLPAALVTG